MQVRTRFNIEEVVFVIEKVDRVDVTWKLGKRHRIVTDIIIFATKHTRRILYMVEKLSRFFTDTKFDDPYYNHYRRDVTPVNGGEPLLYDEDDVFREMVTALEECTRRNIEAGTPQSRHNKTWKSVNMKKRKKYLKYYKDRYEE